MEHSTDIWEIQVKHDVKKLWTSGGCGCSAELWKYIILVKSYNLNESSRKVNAFSVVMWAHTLVIQKKSYFILKLKCSKRLSSSSKH